MTTPERPTSLPVPAVVGQRDDGGQVGGDVPAAVDRVVELFERERAVGAKRDQLARVQRRAAAEATTPSAWCAWSAAAPASMLASVGFGSTPSNSCVAIPACSSDRVMSAAQAGFDHARVGDDERARDAERTGFVAGASALTGSEDDARRKAPDGCHDFCLALGSNGLEVARELPVGDGAFVVPALPVARAHVVVDEVCAEDLARGRACGEPRGRFAQGARQRERAAIAGIALRSGGGSSACSMPQSPAPRQAAMAMYGFMSAAVCRYSTRSAPGSPVITRIAQVRFSMPHAATSGAHTPGT